MIPMDYIRLHLDSDIVLFLHVVYLELRLEVLYIRTQVILLVNSV